MTSHFWLLGVALLSIVACTEPDLSNPYFPRQSHGDMDRLTGDMEGELVSENGCLRIRNIERGYDHLVIWPYDSEMTTDGQGVRVRINDGSEVSLSVGEEVRFGGGSVPLSYVQRRVLQPVPNECLGDLYWVVGEISVSPE